MKPAVWVFAAAVVMLGCAVVWTIVRGEDTRDRVVRTVDPCKHPRSDACQRRIRLVLRELVRRHPDELRKLGRAPKVSKPDGFWQPSGGGGAGSAPSGGGPVGRVPSPGSPPAPNPPSSPPPSSPPADEPALNLDAPLVPKVCVGDLVGVNCP